MVNRYQSLLILIAILLLASFLRFSHLSEMAIFDYDQEWAANFAYGVVREYPLQLIGQGLSVNGLFMGPIGFYLLTPFYLSTGLHPVGGSIGSAVFGLVIIASYFFVGRELIDERAGLVAAFIRAVTFLEISGDLNPAPLTISEILVLWLWWAFYKYWHGSKHILPVIGLILGLFTSLHPVHFPFYLVFLVLFIGKRQLPSFKTGLLTVAGFIAAISPLLLFEILHNFLEVKKLISVFLQPGSEGSQSRWLAHWVDFNLQEVARILATNIPHKELIGAAAVAAVVILVTNKTGFWKDRFHAVMLALSATAFLVYYGLILPKDITEYYFLALRTLIFLYVGASLSLLLRKRLTTLIFVPAVLYIGVANSKMVLQAWDNPSLTTLYHKDQIVQEILKKQPKDQEFYVSYISQLGWKTGFDYLFKFYGQVPQTRELKPPVYTIVIPKFLSPAAIDISSGNVGLILPD